MTQNIRISPDELRAVAGQFKQRSEQSQEMVNALTRAMGDLKSHSEGATSDEVETRFQDWRKSMMENVQLLADIHDNLRRVADEFEVFDKRKKIKT